MSQPAFDFGDVELDDATNPTYTVGELADAINDQLRRGFDDGVWVRGEIDGLSNRGPHTYFSLVENGDDGKAVLNVQLFAPMKRRLRPILKRNRLELRNGMKVRIFGHLDFWAQGGRLGLKMAGLDPRYTLGEIAQSRDEIMRRLVAEGLIDANGGSRCRRLPCGSGWSPAPTRPRGTTSETRLERSGAGSGSSIADTRVQGDLAADGRRRHRHLSRRLDLDVIVVIRGGGARNELAVFDAELIARTIAAAPVPVLTGLGHEIDRSVADEVAHTSLKTPTACAGELIARVNAAVASAEETWRAVVRRAAATLDAATGGCATPPTASPGTPTPPSSAPTSGSASAAPAASLAPAVLVRAEARLDTSASLVRERSSNRVDREADRLDVAAARVAALDPAVQLRRGWSITRAPTARSSGRRGRSTATTELTTT